MGCGVETLCIWGTDLVDFRNLLSTYETWHPILRKDRQNVHSSSVIIGNNFPDFYTFLEVSETKKRFRFSKSNLAKTILEVSCRFLPFLNLDLKSLISDSLRNGQKNHGLEVVSVSLKRYYEKRNNFISFWPFITRFVAKPFLVQPLFPVSCKRILQYSWNRLSWFSLYETWNTILHTDHQNMHSSSV